MSEYKNLSLPESHLTILNILSALVWTDNHLTQQEIELLLEQFKEDLPREISGIASPESTNFTSFGLDVNPILTEQIENRINAELAFKNLIINYHKNPIALPNLVEKLTTTEDKSLAIKLAYMLMSVSQEQKNSIPPKQKAIYRQLIQLSNLDDNLIEEIEWEAIQELDNFQHPFKALIINIKSFININI